jgi:hypothetical protein
MTNFMYSTQLSVQTENSNTREEIQYSRTGWSHRSADIASAGLRASMVLIFI